MTFPLNPIRSSDQIDVFNADAVIVGLKAKDIFDAISVQITNMMLENTVHNTESGTLVFGKLSEEERKIWGVI